MTLTVITHTEMLDSVDRKILEGTREYGPRNLLEVARKIRLPTSTVYNRVNVLGRKDAVDFFAIPDWSRVGLGYRVATIRGVLDKEDEIETGLKDETGLQEMPYLGWYRRADTTHPMYLALTLEPTERRVMSSSQGPNLMYARLRQMQKRGAVEDFKIRNLDGFVYPCSFEGYNEITSKGFQWDLGRNGKPSHYLQKTRQAKKSNPLQKPAGLVDFDQGDLVMLGELVKDGRRKYAKIAKRLGVTLQAIKYRYDRRIVPRNLIRGYGVLPEKFGGAASIYYYLTEFSRAETRNQFLNASSHFTLIPSIGVVSDDRDVHTLLVRVEVPGANYVNPFEGMKAEGIIKSQKMAPLKFTRRSKTFPGKVSLLDLYDAREKVWRT